MLKPVEVLFVEARKQGWPQERLQAMLVALNSQLARPFTNDPGVLRVYAHGAEFMRVQQTDRVMVQSYSLHQERWISHANYVNNNQGCVAAFRDAMEWYPLPERKTILEKWQKVLAAAGDSAALSAIFPSREHLIEFWYDVKNLDAYGQVNPFLKSPAFHAALSILTDPGVDWKAALSPFDVPSQLPSFAAKPAVSKEGAAKEESGFFYGTLTAPKGERSFIESISGITVGREIVRADQLMDFPVRLSLPAFERIQQFHADFQPQVQFRSGKADHVELSAMTGEQLQAEQYFARWLAATSADHAGKNPAEMVRAVEMEIQRRHEAPRQEPVNRPAAELTM